MNHNSQHQPSLLDSYESSENALMDSFKAAALKVTTLYKDSLVQNRKAYASGYQQALQDLYEFISSHPSTTVAQQDALVAPTEQGLLPVQDLLTYARQRNDQLASEMGINIDQISSPSTTISSSGATAANSNTATNAAASATAPSPQQQQQAPSTLQPSSEALSAPSSTAPSFETTTRSTLTARAADTATVPGVVGAAVKNAFHPFQIDPNTQFTFTLPTNYHSYGQPWYTHNNNHHHYHHHHHQQNNVNMTLNSNENRFGSGNIANNNNNDISSNGNVNTFNSTSINNSNNNMALEPMEGLKRRIGPNELSFMGRSLNNMNIDSNWNEPAMKRRSRRDD